MSALSFQEEWLDKLLSGSKQQTTRPQTSRIKVGDVCNIYNQQRRRIAGKPLRRLTAEGVRMVNQKTIEGTYPYSYQPEWHTKTSYAHLLGKVEITEVYDVLPINSCNKEAWAKNDGIGGFADADAWFEAKYGENWMSRTWTVIRWNGWLERYFEPEAI